MRRAAALLGALVLVVAACGGDDAATTTGGTIERVALDDVVDAATLSAIDSAIDQHGPEVAFRAVLFALDDGYDLNQVVTGMDTGSLQADGSIDGLDPSGRASGLIDRSGPQAARLIVLAAPVGLAAGQLPTDVDDFKRSVLDEASKLFLGVDREAERMNRDTGKAVIGTLLALIESGYSLDQVVQALVLGDTPVLVLALEQFRACPAIADGETIIPPATLPDLPAGDACLEFFEGLRDGETTTTTGPATTATTTETADTTGAAGDYSFGARMGDGVEVEFVWTGAFSVVGDELVGSGTVTGFADTVCSVEGGPEYPVAYTASGTFDITGTAAESSMAVILDPTSGSVDVSTADMEQFCVEISIDIANTLAQFPMGSVELTDAPIEVPLGGGSVELDFGGFVFEVTVSAN